MTRGGRPLRFLAMMLGGWTAARVALLWPDAASMTAIVRGFVPQIAAAEPTSTTRTLRTVIQRSTMLPPEWARTMVSVARRPAADAAVAPDPHRAAVALALAGLIRFGEPQRGAALPETIAPALAGPQPRGSRLSGSAWLTARGGGSSGGTFGGGQLGGSQAGIRLVYALDRQRRLAAVARVSAPLKGIGREAAVGIEWRPTHLPIRLVAEERIAIDGGKGGPAIGAIGGIGPLAIGGGFKLEAYGQAGVVDRGRAEGFADGAVRAAHPLATIGKVKVDLGGGLWGGAQVDAARLDIGPSIGATLPIGRRSVRASLDWRARVAGHARPGSGIALTLGTDF